MNDENMGLNPFIATLQPDEVMLWVGRPDEDTFIRYKWREFLNMCAGGAVLAVLFLAVLIFSSAHMNPMGAIGLLLLCVAFVGGLRLMPHYYKYAPWYALTNKHILVAIPDGNSSQIHKTSLDNVQTLEVKKLNGDTDSPGKEMGTVICQCKHTILILLSKRLKVEFIENPTEFISLVNKHLCQ